MRPAHTAGARARASRFVANTSRREVLSFLSDNFAWDECTPAGELEVVTNNGETVRATLILMSEWQAKLPALLSA
jgi:type III restriction enzyme